MGLCKRALVIGTMALVGFSVGVGAEPKGDPGKAPIKFQRVKVDSRFFSEGVAAADVNKDGRMDILAGDLWYENLKDGGWASHRIRNAPSRPFAGHYNGLQYDGHVGYSNSFAVFAQDINRDGWMDAIIIGFPGENCFWYENPQGKEGLWKEHLLWRSACNESPLFADLLGDGKPGVIMGYQPEAQIGFLRPGDDVTKPWSPIAVSKTKSPGTDRYWHGLGVGDVNKDGKQDVIINAGWWQQPANPTAGPWEFHPIKVQDKDGFPPCADIHVDDLDGDGDTDFLASSAHKHGVWWFEQVSGAKGPEYKRHLIRQDVSESHALCYADMDRDGVKDMITGKRFLSHQGAEPGSWDGTYLYWIRITRENGKPVFTTYDIDRDTGHGTQFQVVDFNGDKKLDVLTSNKKGTQLFLQQ